MSNSQNTIILEQQRELKQESRYKDFKVFLYAETKGTFPVSRSKLLKLALKRYKMGEKKFKDKTFLKSKRELVKDIYEELADALVYLFMYYEK
jgi:hypothetical protein